MQPSIKPGSPNVTLLNKWASRHLHFIGQIHFFEHLAFFFLALLTEFKAFGKSVYSALASRRILPQNQLRSDEMGLMNFPIFFFFPIPAIHSFSPLSHMLSSVVKTACNGPANNALFVLDKERKKPDAEGQERRRNTFSACLYIFFSFHYTSGLCWKYLS